MPESISPETLMRQIADGTAPSIVDVRSTKEFTEGHVPGAIHLPFDFVVRQCSPRRKQRGKHLDALTRHPRPAALHQGIGAIVKRLRHGRH